MCVQDVMPNPKPAIDGVNVGRPREVRKLIADNVTDGTGWGLVKSVKIAMRGCGAVERNKNPDRADHGGT
jgi:hypothetical protein